MSTAKKALTFLGLEIEKREKKQSLSFEEYLECIKREPKTALRSIFQLFHDMVKSYVEKGVDEYPDDPESIGFVKYDCSRLLTKGADNPFFADRLFANRFMRQIESLRQGFQQNRVYAYLGPSGCGKSTFLNNLLGTFESYTNTKDGQIFEIVWEIDENLFSGDGEVEGRETFTIPCPSHDCPILIIPKEYRVEFLSALLPDAIEHLREKEYEWIFRGEVCTICKSLFWSLFEKLGSLEKVLGLVKARPYKFDRRVGEGISIFNPGDKPILGMENGRPVSFYFTNRQIQEKLDRMFGTNAVRYVYSHLAKTNNGIYVLMDVKMNNQDRFIELHNVISEGVHKVGDVEEHINSLFFALMNPEDQEIIKEKKMESFQGRIHYNMIPFVLEPSTEVQIYLTIFGETIRKRFLPRIFENFARVVISSRMKIQYDPKKKESDPLKEWIPDIKKYDRFCDEYGILLRMEIYSGVIPDWLSEEDRKKFTAPIRRALIAAGEDEGARGFSGRESIQYFRDFFNSYSRRPSLINMDDIADFFKHKIGRNVRDDKIPKNFLDSLVDSYDYTILNEVKEALYFYNNEQISRDILRYLWAVNYDPGSKVRCEYTGEELEITLDFLASMASQLTGNQVETREALEFARDTQRKYAALVAREPRAARERTRISETDLYRDMFNAYARNLKEKVLQPFINNANFREAIKAFGTEGLEAFDTRLREHVIYMMKNLMEKFGYTEQGAKEICLYVLDKNLAEEFS